jgi:hypothetical protein
LEPIEPRTEGYGYQVKEGRLNSVLETLHRSSGKLTPANAAGFGAFKEASSSGLFSSALAVKGQIGGFQNALPNFLGLDQPLSRPLQAVITGRKSDQAARQTLPNQGKPHLSGATRQATA